MKLKTILMSLIFCSNMFLISCGKNNNSSSEDSVTPPSSTPNRTNNEKMNDIFQLAYNKQVNHKGSKSTIVTVFEDQNIQVYDNNELLSDELVKNLLNDENIPLHQKNGKKYLTSFNVGEKSLYQTSYNYLDNKWQDSDEVSYYFTKNNKEYKMKRQIVNEEYSYNFYELSDGHLNNTLKLTLDSYLDDLITDKSLNGIKSLFIDSLSELFNNQNIEFDTIDNYISGTYDITYKAKLNDINLFNHDLNELDFSLCIVFNEYEIKSIKFESTINYQEVKNINNKNYTFNKTIKNSNVIKFDLDSLFYLMLDEEDDLKLNLVPNVKLIKENGGFNFKYNNHSYLSLNTISLPNELNDLKNVKMEFYLDKELTKRIDINDLKNKSYQQDIYLKFIIDDGYCLIFEDYMYLNKILSSNIKTVNINLETYELEKDFSSKPVYKTIINNKIENNETIKLDNKSIYNIIYKVKE